MVDYSSGIAAHLRHVLEETRLQVEREDRLARINIRRKWRGKDPLWFRDEGDELDSPTLRMLEKRVMPLEGNYFAVGIDAVGHVLRDSVADGLDEVREYTPSFYAEPAPRLTKERLAELREKYGSPSPELVRALIRVREFLGIESEYDDDD